MNLRFDVEYQEVECGASATVPVNVKYIVNNQLAVSHVGTH